MTSDDSFKNIYMQMQNLQNENDSIGSTLSCECQRVTK